MDDKNFMWYPDILDRLQSVVTATARTRRYDHVTPLLKYLHCLLVSERIT